MLKILGRSHSKIVPVADDDIISQEENELLPKAEGLDDTTSLPPIRFIPFDKFKALGTTPRYPDNRDLCVVLSEIDRETALLIFISHCWLRGWNGAVGWDGRPHPDNATNGKYELIIDGVEKMMKIMACAMDSCYLWLDYGCIDQNGDPAGELKQLDKIVEACDCLLTPIYDENPGSWEFDGYSYFDGYKAEGWRGSDYSYLNRGWCRVEMFYGANIPLNEDSEARTGKMKFGLLSARASGRRPHFLYCSTDKLRVAPILLPPLQNSYFEEYDPRKGHLTKASDREKIEELVAKLVPYMKKVEKGYVGEMKDGKKNGKGNYTYADGDVYEGEWKDGKKNGKGKFTTASGDVYDGEYKDDEKNGEGKYTIATGDVYEGEWKDDMMNGKGKYTYADGDIYEGEWKDGNMNGTGKLTTANGHVYEGEWKDDQKSGKGKYTTSNGNVSEGEWKDDKKNGKGKYTTAYGDVYEGEYKDNKMNGEGKFTYANGDVYEGEYKDDMMNGKGKYTFASGYVYEGEWKDGNMNGTGKLTDAQASVYEGEYHDNKQEGVFKVTTATGEIFDVHYAEDIEVFRKLRS